MTPPEKAPPKPHMQAQQAIVRMLFDPAFAAAVRADAQAALPSLPKNLQAQLAAIDPRALKLDRLMRRRVLRGLFDEYKSSTTIFLSRTKKLAALDEFFAHATFEHVVAYGCPMNVAYPTFLMVRDQSLSGIVAIEAGLAFARRIERVPPDGLVHCAPGVRALSTTTGDLAALQQAEQYLFEVGLMPAVALCDDAPPLILDERTRDATPLYLVVVPTETGQSLVTIDKETYTLLTNLPQPMSPALQPLLDDELVVIG